MAPRKRCWNFSVGLLVLFPGIHSYGRSRSTEYQRGWRYMVQGTLRFSSAKTLGPSGMHGVLPSRFLHGIYAKTRTLAKRNNIILARNVRSDTVGLRYENPAHSKVHGMYLLYMRSYRQVPVLAGLQNQTALTAPITVERCGPF